MRRSTAATRSSGRPRDRVCASVASVACEGYDWKPLSCALTEKTPIRSFCPGGIPRWQYDNKFILKYFRSAFCEIFILIVTHKQIRFNGSNDDVVLFSIITSVYFFEIKDSVSGDSPKSNSSEVVAGEFER